VRRWEDRREQIGWLAELQQGETGEKRQARIDRRESRQARITLHADID
jgi:hypothetical protein